MKPFRFLWEAGQKEVPGNRPFVLPYDLPYCWPPADQTPQPPSNSESELSPRLQVSLNRLGAKVLISREKTLPLAPGTLKPETRCLPGRPAPGSSAGSARTSERLDRPQSSGQGRAQIRSRAQRGPHAPGERPRVAAPRAETQLHAAPRPPGPPDPRPLFAGRRRTPRPLVAPPAQAARGPAPHSPRAQCPSSWCRDREGAPEPLRR